MKTLISFLVAMFLVGYVADAQVVAYRDSIDGNGVTTAAKHTRGGGEFRYSTGRTPKLNSVYYPRQLLAVSFAYSTDSIKVQGAEITTSSTSSSDTVWHDIPLIVKIQSGINTGAGVNTTRDTVLYWASPMSNANGSTNILAEFGATPFPLYRFMVGKNDSLARFNYIRAR